MKRASPSPRLQGLDIVVEGHTPLALRYSPSWRRGPSLGVARITVDGESMALRGGAGIALSGVKVRLPPGAFLQAAREAEAVLAGLVQEGVGDARSASPICSPASARSPSPCAEAPRSMPSRQDEEVIAVLAEACGQDESSSRSTRSRRDLFRVPLTAGSLAATTRSYSIRRGQERQGAGRGAGGVGGAEDRHGLLQSGNLARDLRILVDGGYRIARIVPVDQFLFSPHVEMVADLER